jgi:hypothetical protein
MNDQFLLWDNDRHKYVLPHFSGWTPYRSLAGKFTEKEAEAFCAENQETRALPLTTGDK